MDFALNARQREVQRKAREYAAVVSPVAAELDRKGHCPADIVAGCRAGLLGCEHDFVAPSRTVELSKVWASLSAITAVQIRRLLPHCALR
jgi:hypothetical protein